MKKSEIFEDVKDIDISFDGLADVVSECGRGTLITPIRLRYSYGSEEDEETKSFNSCVVNESVYANEIGSFYVYGYCSFLGKVFSVDDTKFFKINRATLRNENLTINVRSKSASIGYLEITADNLSGTMIFEKITKSVIYVDCKKSSMMLMIKDTKINISNGINAIFVGINTVEMDDDLFYGTNIFIECSGSVTLPRGSFYKLIRCPKMRILH